MAHQDCLRARFDKGKYPLWHIRKIHMHFEKVAEPSPRFPLLEGPESHSPGTFRLGLGTLANPRTLEIYCTLTDPDQGVPEFLLFTCYSLAIHFPPCKQNTGSAPSAPRNCRRRASRAAEYICMYSGRAKRARRRRLPFASDSAAFGVVVLHFAILQICSFPFFTLPPPPLRKKRRRRIPFS